LDNLFQEMMTSGNLVMELGRWEDGRVHLSAQTILDRAQSVHQLTEAHVADDHQVDIAGSLLPARCKGPVDERGHDPLGERLEGFPKEIPHTGGLQDKPAELGSQRTALVDPEVLLLAFSCAEDDSEVCQTRQLAAEVGGVLAEDRGQLTDEIALIGVREEPTKNPSPEPRSEQVLKDGGRRSGIHSARSISHCKNFTQLLSSAPVLSSSSTLASSSTPKSGEEDRIIKIGSGGGLP
jgi:hypothetical protein